MTTAPADTAPLDEHTTTDEAAPPIPGQITNLQQQHADDLVPLLLDPHTEMDRWIVQPHLLTANVLAVLAWSQHLAQCRYEIRRDDGLTRIAAIGVLDGLLLEVRGYTHRHVPADATGVVTFEALQEIGEHEADDRHDADQEAAAFYDQLVGEQNELVAAVLDGLPPATPTPDNNGGQP